MNSPQAPAASVSPRRQLAWRIALTALLLAAVALVNAFSERSDSLRLGQRLPLREPLVWEFSSVILIGVLIPAVAWLLRRVPLDARRWYRWLPVHLLATVPFSILHVAGMVGLRKLAYAAAGATYRFGPAVAGWVYEYRKDFVVYCFLVAFLSTGNAWRYWRRRHAELLATGGPKATLPPPAGGVLDRLVVRGRNREFILDVAAIARLESAGNYVAVHAQGGPYELRGSLAALCGQLDPRRFVQIHRSHVVNVDHVREIQPWDHGDFRVLLDDGSVINFSRRYRSRLQARFSPAAHAQGADAARP